MLQFLDELDAECAGRHHHGRHPRVRHARWWTQLLHNQSALALKARLLYRPNTVVTSVPVHID